MKIFPSLMQTIASLAIVFTVAGFMSAQNRRVLAKAESVTGDRFSFAVRTAKGVNIFAAERPSLAMLAAVDRGLADLFTVARKNRYYKRLRYSDYTVFIAKADRDRNAQGDYSPDIAVGAAQYAGSIYDQGGFIYAAGMVIAFNPASFVIADHKKDFNRVSDVVRYEGEHLVLYHNDRRRYGDTADHSKSGGHPILQ